MTNPDGAGQPGAAEPSAGPRRAPVAHGESFKYRPNELLLDAPAAQELADVLAARYGGRIYRYNADPDYWRNDPSVALPAETGDLNGRLSNLGHELWTLAPGPHAAHLPALVRELRGLIKGVGRGPRVSLNHVYRGEPLYQGGPDGDPFPIVPLQLAAAGGTAGQDADIGVLDTGLPDGWQTLHPSMAGWLRPDFDNQNLLVDAGSTFLADEAGHGMFICGLILRLAPGLTVDPGRVLDPDGHGDDASIASELGQTDAKVICLSLGGYTDDNQAPPALAAALAALPPGVAVVAAAGNNGSDVKFWPAAFENVIAVAGYDSTGGQRAKAGFSNFGDWVDICAPAVNVGSTYVTGDWPAPAGQSPRHFAGWARWSGTSFAAPQVAAAIARKLAEPGGPSTAQAAADALKATLSAAPWDGFGLLYDPGVDLTQHTDVPGAS